MTEWFFEAPARVQDFTDPSVWHSSMLGEAQDIVTILVATVLNKSVSEITEHDIQTTSPTLAYVNPAASPPPADAQTINVAPWGAFPRAVERQAPWPLPHDPDDVTGNLRAVEHWGEEDERPGRWSDVDGNSIDPLELRTRDRQDEYLEWVVRRNAEQAITKAIFVAEGYDYYATLFEHDPKRVVELYREFTGISHLEADDLRAPRGIVRHSAGRTSPLAEPSQFNPRNKFNLDPGIVHLSHRANSLGAEINLAGVSGIARKDANGTTLQPGQPERLLCCSEGGNPNRNSDPLIGEQAYAQVLEGRRYTLANPVGLYIAGVAEQRLTLPNGEPAPREWWKVVRGEGLWNAGASRVLRLEIEVPASEGILLGDLQVDGNPLKYGGQLAQLLSVHLFVTRWSRTDHGIGPVVNCTGTCCRRQGTPELVTTESNTCPAGFEAVFPDLLPPPAHGAPVLAVKPASVQLRAATRRMSRLP